MEPTVQSAPVDTPVAAEPVKPANYLSWAVLVTILLIVPGFLSLRHAIRVDQAWNAGRVAEAQAESALTKRWLVISGCVYALLAALLIIGMVLLGQHAATPGSGATPAA